MMLTAYFTVNKRVLTKELAKDLSKISSSCQVREKATLSEGKSNCDGQELPNKSCCIFKAESICHYIS